VEKMKQSDQGIDLIKRFEGVRLKAYDDGVGVLTIGYGHTSGVHWGDVITEDEAENLLQEDLEDFEECVNDLVDVSLNQAQFDALVSFTFNVGCGAFRRSTLLRKLNKGDYKAAANQLLRWNRGGGRVLKGLVRRRQAERDLFLSAGTETTKPVPEPTIRTEDAILNNIPVTNSCLDIRLYKGKRGPCVKVLQRALNNWIDAMSHTNMDYLKPDSDFGRKTFNRVQSFQRAYELFPDGVVGEKTWDKLRKYL
jgi:lysozyme